MARSRRALVTVHEYLTRELLTVGAAEYVVACAQRSIRDRHRFIVALSGGTTPHALYELLATQAYVQRIDWSAVYVCFGDERCVPPTDAQSNYKMANDTLLAHVPIPGANILRMHGEDAPASAALAYERELRALLATPHGAPAEHAGQRFDLVLLGLGADGHTASLFPQGAAVREHTQWVAAEYADAVATWRLSLTLPVINAARDVMFLVAGADKAAVLQRVLETPPDASRLPAQGVVPLSGQVTWMVDAAAGSMTTAWRRSSSTRRML